MVCNRKIETVIVISINQSIVISYIYRGTFSVQLYSYGTSVNLVFVFDNIIDNSDNFRQSQDRTVK